MKRLLLIVGVLCQSIFWGAEVPALTGRLVDQANIFSALEKATLEAQLEVLEMQTGGQMAVLFERRLPAGETVETRALQVAEAWGIGYKGKDNGLLFYVALEDRRNRLEVGTGWEALITDARAGDILRGIVPHLRKEAYADAVKQVIKEVQRCLSGEAPEKEPQKSLLVTLLSSDIFVYILVAFLVLSNVFGGFRGGHRGGSVFGGFSGGGFSGGGFRGGGGGFSGGGSSGRW